MYATLTPPPARGQNPAPPATRRASSQPNRRAGRQNENQNPKTQNQKGQKAKGPRSSNSKWLEAWPKPKAKIGAKIGTD